MTYSEVQFGELNLDFKVLVKTVEVDGVQIEIKMRTNKKNNSLKHWATGVGFLRQLRVSRVLSSC